jgi:hypothetical protein
MVVSWDQIGTLRWMTSMASPTVENVNSFELTAAVSDSVECDGIRAVHDYNFPINFRSRKSFGKQKTNHCFNFHDRTTSTTLASF